jgi:hypothetical protein
MSPCQSGQRGWYKYFFKFFSYDFLSVSAFQVHYQGIIVYQKVLSSWQSITYNGPAIWGGCVTRRQHRAGSWYFSQKAVTVQGRYGALFAVMVQILLRAGAIAVQI